MSDVLITAGPFSFEARFETADAPRTVAVLRSMAPLQESLVHVRWSGEAVWVPMGERSLDLPPENATAYPLPGQILLYPGGVSETELILAYGHCQFASKAGVLAGNHALTIVAGVEQLRELGRRALWEGAQPFTLRVKY